jgi:hypothetical protein
LRQFSFFLGQPDPLSDVLIPFQLSQFTYDLTAEPDACQSRSPQGFSDGLAPSFPNGIGRAW